MATHKNLQKGALSPGNLGNGICLFEQAPFMASIPPPPEIPSPEYNTEYELVKELGGLNNTLRDKNGERVLTK